MMGRTEITRRDALKMGAAGTLSVMAGRAAWAAEKKIPIGVQLYMLKSMVHKDLPGNFKKIKAMGVDGVEFAGYYGKKAEELRKILDDAGLKCCGTHTRMNTLTGDALKKTVEFNKVLGNKYLVVPMMSLKDKAACVKNAGILTEIAGAIKGDGMVTGYHAHGGDFKVVEGKTKWEHLFDNVGPDVMMQMDTGNCLGGGGDPVAMLKKYPGRSLTIHLKEQGAHILGEGKVPLKEVIEICETTGKTEWYIIEQEGGPIPPMERLKKCADNLMKMV